MSKNEAPRLYTAEEIYDLVGNMSNFKSQLELAKSFEDAPYDTGGVAVYEHVLISTAGGKVPAICFNGQLSDAELSALRKPDAEALLNRERNYASTNEEQYAAREKVRPTLPRLLGRLSVSGAAGFGTGYELIATTTDIVPSTLTGFGALASTYLVARGLGRRRERKRAQESITQLTEKIFDRDHGGIGLLRDKRYSFSASDFVEDEDGSEAADAQSSFMALGSYRQKNGECVGLISSSTAGEVRWVDITPARLVKGILDADEHPRKLWQSGFGESVRELSETERLLIESDLKLADAKKWGEFTGHPDLEEIAACESEVRQARHKLLRVTHSLVEQYETHWHTTKAEALIADITSGETTEAHPFEMQLQTLISIACRGLGKLDLATDDTHVIADSLVEYLKGTREMLNDSSQMEQFYRGLYDKFSDSLPDLPKWEEVSHQFVSPQIS